MSKPIPVSDIESMYKGKILEVVQQDMKIGDKQVTFEWARRSPGTRLIVLSKDKRILLTKEFRREMNDWDYRLPGGKVFDTLTQYVEFLNSGKDILSVAKDAVEAEAAQEAGIEVKAVTHYHTSKNGATVEWDLYYFIATDYVELNDGQKLEVGEDIRVEWFTFDEAMDICLKGGFKEDRSLGVLLKFILENR
ncbi:NUDIX domain-containing protein [Candidatus Dojkabacteria bacterium]|nr:NUDIX domain-containing protein [Candidatus Dojkabacteria bacterium]